MKTIYLILLSSILPLLFITCYDDAGNYDYRDINEIQMSRLVDQVKYAMVDTLRINPVVEFTQNPDAEYTYEWSVRSLASTTTGEVNEDIVIGKEKELNYFVTLSPGSYALLLRVTDPTTDLVWTMQGRLTVASTTYQGWLVLCNENGRARLDMAEESGSTPRYNRDILAPYLSKNDPIAIEIVCPTLEMNRDIFMMTGDGCNRLVTEDLSWNISEDFPYTLANPSLGDMKVQAFGVWYARSGTVMIGDGNAYWRKTQGTPLFGLPINQVEGKYVKVAPYIGIETYMTTLLAGGTNYVLFDQDNLRFIRYAADDKNCSVLTDFPQGKELVFMQNTKEDGATFALLRNPSNDSYTILKFYANRLEVEPEVAIDIPDIDKMKFFAFDYTLTYMFYSDGESLSLYNWTALDPNNRISPVSVLEDAPITMLKYKNYPFDDPYGGYLLAGTLDEDGQGVLHVLNVSVNSTVEEVKNYDGFAPIVDVAYRPR